MIYLFLYLIFLSSAHASPYTAPPPGSLIVAKTNATYRTIQSAINALNTTSPIPQTIFIHAGIYAEQISIPLLPSPLTIYGATNNTFSYISNTVTLTSSRSQANTPGGNDATATLRAWTSNLKVYNLNIVNGYGKGSQAVALSSQRSGQGYYGCQFWGYQDTVLVNEGKSLMVGGLVVGVTDFVFGMRGVSWWEGVDVRVLGAGLGYITASGRSSAADPSYFVFNNCSVAASPSATVPAGAFYLGRPWREYARVVFQSSHLSNIINPTGWRIWNTGDENTEHVMFGEWGNTGPGAAGNGSVTKRAKFGTKLDRPVGREEVLGKGWEREAWVDREHF